MAHHHRLPSTSVKATARAIIRNSIERFPEIGVVSQAAENSRSKVDRRPGVAKMSSVNRVTLPIEMRPARVPPFFSPRAGSTRFSTGRIFVGPGEFSAINL